MSNSEITSISMNITSRGIFAGLANDEIVKLISTGVDYEPHLISAFSALIDSGDVVLDIGANIGYHSVVMSRLVGSQGVVYAFEPQELIYRFLCANTVLNNSLNVVPTRAAVGNANGFLSLSPIDYSVANLNSGCQRISSGGEKVSVITLDSFEFDRPPSFVKIDAQGAEPHIISGALSLLSSKYRPIICFEVEDIWLRALGTNTNVLLNLLLSLNFLLIRIKTSYPCDHIAVPHERASVVLKKLEDFDFPLEIINGSKISVHITDNNLYDTYDLVA
jgi:FkbM family methyltransferase